MWAKLESLTRREAYLESHFEVSGRGDSVARPQGLKLGEAVVGASESLDFIWFTYECPHDANANNLFAKYSVHSIYAHLHFTKLGDHQRNGRSGQQHENGNAGEHQRRQA